MTCAGPLQGRAFRLAARKFITRVHPTVQPARPAHLCIVHKAIPGQIAPLKHVDHHPVLQDLQSQISLQCQI